MARKLQQDEEEESKFRRDVSDLGRRLAIEAQDRELAIMLQEKEKARLRKAKEKARLIKAQQKAAAANRQESLQQAKAESPPPVTHNVAACLDPTWQRRQEHIENQQHSQMSLPITDLGKAAATEQTMPRFLAIPSASWLKVSNNQQPISRCKSSVPSYHSGRRVLLGWKPSPVVFYH